MRRADRKITDFGRIIEILDKCKVCTLGMNDNGIPYIVPLNFGYESVDNEVRIYVHGAAEGRKVDTLRKDPTVCFETHTNNGLIGGDKGCSYSCLFESIIGCGKAEFLDGDDKIHGLKVIMKHLTGTDDHEFQPKVVEETSVIMIRLTEISAKVRK